jgi:hypothetical protein
MVLVQCINARDRAVSAASSHCMAAPTSAAAGGGCVASVTRLAGARGVISACAGAAIGVLICTGVALASLGGSCLNCIQGTTQSTS